MNATDKIVRAALLRYRKIFLPGAGTLYIEYKSAEKVSPQLFMPPCNGLVFTDRQLPGAPSAVDEIVSHSRLSESQAQELYSFWLKEARGADGSIHITGVGTVSAKGIETDETFGRLLNPAGRQSVKIKTRKKTSTVAAASVAAAAVAAACIWGICEYRTSSTAGTSVAQETIYPGPDAQPPVQQTDSAIVAESQAVQTADTTLTRTVPAEQPDTTESAGIHYIIAGTFSIEDNADRYISQLQEKFPDLECVKIRLSSKRWMVSIASTQDSDRARRLLSELRYVKPDLWIHTALNR